MPLGFYAIDDADPTPDDPDELRHVGDVGLRDHHSLRHVWAACDAAPGYFTDSRLTAAQLVQLRDCLVAHMETGAGPNTVVRQLVTAFDIALEQGCGVVAFAD